MAGGTGPGRIPGGGTPTGGIGGIPGGRPLGGPGGSIRGARLGGAPLNGGGLIIIGGRPGGGPGGRPGGAPDGITELDDISEGNGVSLSSFDVSS